MAVEVLAQTTRVADVSDVVMTAIEQDPESGHYVREFRVFGTPPEGVATAPLIFTLRVDALSRAALEVTTPTLQV